jgi:hypothetical protein
MLPHPFFNHSNIFHFHFLFRKVIHFLILDDEIEDFLSYTIKTVGNIREDNWILKKKGEMLMIDEHENVIIAIFSLFL